VPAIGRKEGRTKSGCLTCHFGRPPVSSPSETNPLDLHSLTNDVLLATNRLIPILWDPKPSADSCLAIGIYVRMDFRIIAVPDLSPKTTGLSGILPQNSSTARLMPPQHGLT